MMNLNKGPGAATDFDYEGTRNLYMKLDTRGILTQDVFEFLWLGLRCNN